MEIIVAFDIGLKRVGVAVSDPFLSYATPSDTYFRTGKTEEDALALARIAASKGATRIVCGLPLNRDGTESVQSQKTRAFAERLKEVTPLPVVFEDERYTTRAARDDLVRSGVSARKDKRTKHVDSLAAAYILESYLKSHGGEFMSELKEVGNDYDEDVIEIVDEEGVHYRYEHLMTFEYKGEWYVALTPEQAAEAEEEAGEEGEEVAIYRVAGEENDEHLETIDDEALLDEVFAEFCAQYEDFEDADEAASLEPDEEE